MTSKTVAQKGHVKPGTRIAVLHPIPTVVEGLGLEDCAFVEASEAQLVFVFAGTRAELDARMPDAIARMGSDTKLWVFFRKGSKGSGLDMNRDDVWAVADAAGLRPVGLLSVDDSWSVFRFRRGEHP